MPHDRGKHDGAMQKALRTTETPCNSAVNSLDVNASFDLDNVNVEKDVLTPQKLADHLSSSVQSGDGECPIKAMPDNIMLEILGYLSFKDLCKAARVCRGWNHLVKQKPLWRVVDLSSYKINLTNLRKLIFAYFSDSLRKLSLGGFLYSAKNTECISDSLLQELGIRCPNLQELSISTADLSKASSRHLPSKLKTLKLISCNYPPFWLTKAFKQSRLDSLRHLEMSGSNGFGIRDLESLTASPIPSLQTIKLDHCHRVAARGACRIADNFPNLQELDLSSMTLSNEALQKIGSSLTDLRILKLHCTSNGDIVPFDLHHLSPLKQLEELDFTHIPDNGLGNQKAPYHGNVLVGLVNNLPKLKVLLISENQSFTKDIAKGMKNACIMPPKEGDSKLLLRIGFYPCGKLELLAKQQAL